MKQGKAGLEVTVPEACRSFAITQRPLPGSVLEGMATSGEEGRLLEELLALLWLPGGRSLHFHECELSLL